MLASHFFIFPDLDLLDMLPLQETISGFQVFHGSVPTSHEILDKAHGLIVFESDWTGSQLAVTLQAVSGLVNCDVVCTEGLPTGTLACRLPNM